jgi:hypothetical protein
MAGKLSQQPGERTNSVGTTRCCNLFPASSSSGGASTSGSGKSPAVRKFDSNIRKLDNVTAKKDKSDSVVKEGNSLDQTTPVSQRKAADAQTG